jgi:hypothetical protein
MNPFLLVLFWLYINAKLATIDDKNNIADIPIVTALIVKGK